MTHRYVRANGTRLHIAEAGEGPVVVLLHGWPQHWWIWRKVIPALAEGRRVICPDLRGFGWSDAPPHVYRSFLTRELTRLKKGRYRSRRLTVPTRLLAGEADPVIRPEILAGFEPYAEGMSVETVERCGHFVAEERPDVVIERARELFGTVASAS